MVETTIDKAGKITKERRYYISSLDVNAEEFSRAVRGHWAIESMHWQLDVTFREDNNQTIDKRANENLNIIRKWCLSMLKILDMGKPYSMKLKRIYYLLCTGAIFCRIINVIAFLKRRKSYFDSKLFSCVCRECQ